MFVATPQNQVIALDAKTGDEIWRYNRELPEDLFQLHPTSRGVGLWQDKLYLATTDDHLVALDAKNGKGAWDQKVQDYKKGQYMTLTPLVVNGKVIVGGSGGEFGVRGFIAAFDAKTARSCGAPTPSRRRASPAANLAGRRLEDRRRLRLDHRHLRSRHRARPIGAQEMPRPGPAATHPGDNLYTSAVIALDPETGKIKSYHQYHPNEGAGIGTRSPRQCWSTSKEWP